MKHFANRWAPAALALALFSGCTAASGSDLPDGAITIARQGSFEAGGKVIGDPATSSLACDHGHVEYQIPVEAKPIEVAGAPVASARARTTTNPSLVDTRTSRSPKRSSTTRSSALVAAAIEGSR